MPRILLSLVLSFFFSSFLLCPAFAQIAAPVLAPQANADQTAQAETISQQIRAEERQMDLQATGLKWFPWNDAGKPTKDFIASRDQFYKSLIGSGRHVDVAVYDMDGNGQPDMVLFFWDHCGNQGCLYKIYFDQETKNQKDFFGWEFIPYKKGVMLDHAYFTL